MNIEEDWGGWMKPLALSIENKKIPSCNPNSDVEVHSLVCSKHVYGYLLAIVSFLKYYNDVSVVVHDDGTLSEDDKKLILNCVNGARIISKEEADNVVNPLLQNHPECKRYRDEFVNAKQLFDFVFLSRGKKIIALDSDTLFLKGPTELIDWIKNPKNIIRYNYEESLEGQITFRKSFGIEINLDLNIGFLCFFENLINLNSIERILKGVANFDWYTGQNIFSVLITGSNYLYDPFDKKDYQCLPSFKESDPVFRHYFTSSHVYGYGSVYEKDAINMINSLDGNELQVSSRDELPRLLNDLKLFGKGVEIGVQSGFYSRQILLESKLETLYSVDPWIHFPSEEYVDIANISQEEQNGLYLQTIKLLMRFKTRSVCMRLTSEDAANVFQKDFFDFVYIDANHSYEGCKRDINLWWSKLRSGGVFAGHDYVPDGLYGIGNKPTEFGVMAAVNEFMTLNNLKLYTTKEDHLFLSWYVIKP